MPYIIQGDTISLPTDPFPHFNTHFVSLREVTDALGGSVEISEDRATFTATIGPWSAAVKSGEANVDVEGNGQSVPVAASAPPYTESGEMFVPYDFFSEAFGYDVTIDDGTVTIVNPNAL